MAAVFDFKPLYSYQSSAGRRVRITEFESGKEQRADKGPSPREWALSFGGTRDYIDRIVAFYNARKGPFEAFQWTPPGESIAVTVRFKDESITSKNQGMGKAFTDLTLREVL
jgi:Phage-related protein